MQRPKTSLANRAGSANAKNLIAVAPIEAIKANRLPKCLIIGSGAAGLLCMDKLREYGFIAPGLITVLTADSHLPYDRPKLSKKLDVDINSIALRDANYFAKNNINYKTNQHVDSVDFANKTVLTKTGERFEYDKLIIATGLAPLGMPSKPGNNLNGKHKKRFF